MPSTTPEARPRHRRSLLRRVVVSSVLAAAVGAAIAATTGGLATTGFVDEHEEETLRISTQRLAEEVEEEQEEDQESLAEALADELGDVDYVGARGAVHQAGAFVGGDAAVPPQPPGTCAHVDLSGVPHRACTVSLHGREVTLAASTAYTQALRPLYVLATLLGIGVGVLAGGLLGHRAARWGLGPFIVLRDQVKRVRPHAPSSDVLEPPADYAELEELRRAIADLVERLGDALSHAQRFAAQASHELRTPLTAIAGEIELLRETSPASDTSALETLQARVQGMTRLVERLLVLAVPRDPEVGEAVDLADVAAEALAALPAAERGRVHTSLADDVLVRGDATLLRAALLNALENALKFSTEAVELRISGVLDEAWLEVVDRGPGVPPAERRRVFEPFYRAAAARALGTRGSGIGLALISHVVGGHGGRAEFVDVQRGACLRISLPRWRSEARRSAGAAE
jgi:signal transduction histidine kinase